jgi:hypothetical protein
MDESKDGNRSMERDEMLRAFISPQNQANSASNLLSKDRLTRNQVGLKPSLSEGLTDGRPAQQTSTLQAKSNPTAFQSFSTDKLAAKLNKVKAISTL